MLSKLFIHRQTASSGKIPNLFPRSNARLDSRFPSPTPYHKDRADEYLTQQHVLENEGRWGDECKDLSGMSGQYLRTLGTVVSVMLGKPVVSRFYSVAAIRQPFSLEHEYKTVVSDCMRVEIATYDSEIQETAAIAQL